MKVTVETTPIQRAFLTVGTERTARDTAARLWPHLDPKVRNIVVAIIRDGTVEDDQ